MTTHPRFRRLAARTLLATLLVAGIAACGDDDGDTTRAAGDKPASKSTQSEASEKASEQDVYCGALVEFNAAVTQTEIGDDATPEEVKKVAADLDPVWQKVEANAPEAVADDIATLGETMAKLSEGDAKAFNAEETRGIYSGVLSETAGDCGFEDVGATAVDYKFEGLPTTVKAGPATLTLENTGKEEHEMILMKKAKGETRDAKALLSLPEEEAMKVLTFTGAAFAPPGQTGVGLAELTPGEYVVTCFIPVGGGEDGPPHFTEGMFAELTVE